MANSLDAVSDAFKLSIESMRNSSPLYEALATRIVDDPEMLDIASVGREEQFPPLIFFGAVRYLLLGEMKGHELEKFYPDLCESLDQARSPQDTDAYPIFRQFCLDYKDPIQHIITTRLIQTNEVRRCSVMVPAFGIVAELIRQPLVLIEIGSSAGINLNWDRYHYHYTGGVDLYCGQPDSVLTLGTEIQGEYVPPIPAQLPTVTDRIGIDLNPLDPADEKVRRWLHALIWPEHIERWQNLAHALDIIQEHRPEVIAGNALDVLPNVLHQVTREGALCIFHSMVIYQFSAEMAQQLDDILIEHSHQRDIYRVWFEWEPDLGASVLRLFAYKHSAKESNMLATADPHGRWIQWQGE